MSNLLVVLLFMSKKVAINLAAFFYSFKNIFKNFYYICNNSLSAK